MTALFEFRDVTVVRAGRTVLDRIDLALDDDGITVVTGVSGSGKSTLLRLCNRLLEPDVGDVRHRGIDLRSVDPLELRRRVGMVFQKPTPFPGTVLDNLRSAADLTRADAAELVESVALHPDLIDRDAGELSGGEQQRVCLARTLATRPETLLVDEGTSSLDTDSTRTLEELALRIATGGQPVVWVTHDLAQAERIATHRVALERGRVVEP